MKKLQLTLITSFLSVATTFSVAHAQTQTPGAGIQTEQQKVVHVVKNKKQIELEQEAKKPLMFCKGFPLCQEKIGGGRSDEMIPATDLFTTPNQA